ncbi:NAD(P)-dependent oxidoreductase [Paraburkholderia flava]|uniref:NAD(P)-dependent oxidoreductase n=1 Tax=Paraburkholderia flava TaxID=2547393 RepID=UPI00105B459E|nr:NAD(P)-dependent oxidoreductase [Paraburkholderia flava]
MFNQIFITDDVYLSDHALREVCSLSTMPLLYQSSAGGRLDGCDAILASWGATLDAPFFAQFGALRYVGLRCTSTGKVDVDFLNRRNVPWTNLGRYGDFGTCEFVIQQLLNITRTHAANTLSVSQRELRGKTLGIIGFGGVGQLVGEAALGLGMQVFVATRGGRPESMRDSLTRCRFGSIDEVVAAADFISIHTPAYTPVLSRDVLMRARREVVMTVTTLGLPFLLDDIAAFLLAEPTRQVVCDLCAASHLSPDELPENFDVVQVYSARTHESVERAERELVDNLRYHAGGFAHA